MKEEKVPVSTAKEPDEVAGHRYRLLRLIPGRQLALSVLYGTLRIVVAAVWPFYLYRAIKKTGMPTNSGILPDILLIAFLLALSAVAAHLQSRINVSILKTFTLDLISRLWTKMNALDWLTFHRSNRVYYFDMLMMETWRLRAGVAALLETLIINSLIAGILSLFIAFISWPLFLVCLGGLLLMGAGYYGSTLKTRPLIKQFQAAWRTQHLWIAKCLDQFDLIKMGRGYETSAAAHLEQSGVFLESNARMLTNQAKWRNINQLLANMVRIGVFIIGIYWVRSGVVGLDDLLLVLLIVSIIQANIAQIPAALNNFIESQESLKTVSTFLMMEEEQAGTQRPSADQSSVKKISIRDLSYSYDERPVIEQIDMDLEAGKIYLWQGANGSGKSTVAHILLGLLHPKQGSVSINDRPSDWKELAALRNRFAFLHQDAPIFMGSIRENVLFGHPQPERAWDKLQTTWLSGLLPKDNEAGHWLVGERGEGLSGGQAQCIGLIRELLRSADLLILDEPLNHLDEYAIQEIKREILEIRTHTIVIIISKPDLKVLQMRSGSFDSIGNLTPAQQLLIRSCLTDSREERERIIRSWEDEVQIEDLDFRSSRLIPYFLHGNQQLGITTRHDKRLKNIYKHWWLRTQHLSHQLSSVHKAFADAGIDTMVIKGASLKRHYEHDVLRPMSDFDLVVHPADLRKALHIVKGLGYEPLRSMEAHFKQYPKLFLDFNYAITCTHQQNNCQLDLHWRIGSHCSAKFSDELWSHLDDYDPLPGAKRPLLAYEVFMLVIHAVDSDSRDNLNWIIDMALVNRTAGQPFWEEARKLAIAEKKEDLFDYGCSILLKSGVDAPDPGPVSKPLGTISTATEHRQQMSSLKLFRTRMINIVYGVKRLYPHAGALAQFYQMFRSIAYLITFRRSRSANP